MKPLRLQIQGLTAYHQRAEIDFSNLDLFAITGPTGAGKSSLVDAMTYALFGQVPRVGRNVKELISQGDEKLQVAFEFTVNGGRYRIHRATARKGAAPVQLEHYDKGSDEWLPDEDRVKEATERIEKLLGMDYEGFIRSVLLPQGQFQQFLAGEPEQRRKVLDGLLRLETYQRMQQKANQLAQDQTRDAGGIRQLLDTQFADATPDALREAKAQLAELKAKAEALAATRLSLEDASRAAEALAQARKRRDTARAALASAEPELEKARALLESGQNQVDQLNEELAALDKRIAASPYDADLHGRLTQALVIVQRLEKDEQRLAQLSKEIAAREPLLPDLRAAGEAAATAVGQADAAVAAAVSHLEEIRRHNLAADLRSGLRPGDPCPVCGQKTATLPPAEHADIQEAEEALAAARSATLEAQRGAQAAEQERALAEQELASFVSQRQELSRDCETQRTALAKLLPGERPAAAQIAARVREQDAARKDRDSLEKDARDARQKRDAQASALATAGADVARLDAQLQSARKEAAAAATEIESGEAALRVTATSHDWPDVLAALGSGLDASALLRGSLEAAQRDTDGVNRESGACEARIQQITQGIQKAKDLRAQEKEKRDAALLARDLATLLRTDRFQAFVRESALRVLAEDGSRRLHEISGGRYEFKVEGQEFFVIDGWNGAEQRSVKTLSGGETFLASLALALALAEQLPGLNADADGAALESLFIDEGFSYLDEDTLDTVASALEVLGRGGERLIGVITHMPGLAERMPARITVHKSQSGSTLSVE